MVTGKVSFDVRPLRFCIFFYQIPGICMYCNSLRLLIYVLCSLSRYYSNHDAQDAECRRVPRAAAPRPSSSSRKEC